MTELEESDLGWFHIDEVWNLYQDAEDGRRSLVETHVDYICVDEHYTGNGYVVDHYDRSGDLITTLHLDADDIEPEVANREPTDRPYHI